MIYIYIYRERERKKEDADTVRLRALSLFFPQGDRSPRRTNSHGNQRQWRYMYVYRYSHVYALIEQQACVVFLHVQTHSNIIPTQWQQQLLGGGYTLVRTGPLDNALHCLFSGIPLFLVPLFVVDDGYHLFYGEAQVFASQIIYFINSMYTRRKCAWNRYRSREWSTVILYYQIPTRYLSSWPYHCSYYVGCTGWRHLVRDKIQKNAPVT